MGIQTKILSIIKTASLVKKLYENSHLIDDLGLDELDMQEIILSLEEEFNIDEIPLETAESWRTVADVIKYVEGVCNRQS